VRLVGALLLEQNDEWQLQRRYMQLEELLPSPTINFTVIYYGCPPWTRSAQGDPVHLDDYDRFKSPLEDFKRAASAAGLTSQLMYLERGEGTSLIELSIG
jgi:hypothetical protein